jgi:hypothetical protein
MPPAESIKDRTAERRAALRERTRPRAPVLPSYDEPPDLDEQWQTAVERDFHTESQTPEK